VVVCGDGHLLMNLGCLVTLAAHPADVFLVVVDNGVYEVTGGQPSPGAGRTDFAGLARAAGNAGFTLATPPRRGAGPRPRRCPGRGRWSSG
jgi:thiamine pyrophosphate-dependent acetolactate synthase large subunit-like protein